MGPSRSFHSKDSQTPKKAVKFKNIMDPGLTSSSPLSFSRYNEHEPEDTEASISRFKYYNNTYLAILRINIRFQTTKEPKLAHESNQNPYHTISGRHIHLSQYPQPTRRQHARSLDNLCNSNDSMKLQTHTSSGSEFSPLESTSLHQWNAQSETRERLGGIVTVRPRFEQFKVMTKV